MKQFLVKISTFAIPLILLSYPLDKFISKSIVKSHKYPDNYNTWNDIYEGKAYSDILIFGSSRATHHYDPMLMEDNLNQTVYNLGINGHGFWLQHLKYLEYLKHNKKPKTIIINVGWFSLEKRSDLYQYNQFLPYMLFNKNIWKYTHTYEGFTNLDYIIPCLRYFGNRTAMEQTWDVFFKKNNRPPYKIKGFVAVSDENGKSVLTENLQIKNKTYQAQIDLQTLELLNSFLAECKKQNINTILVYSPEYINEQKRVINRNEALALLANLANKYNVLFWDYSKHSLSLSRKYFNSTMHLNHLGSHKFTENLIKRIKSQENDK